MTAGLSAVGRGVAAVAMLAGAGCISFTGPASALRPLPRGTTPVWHDCDARGGCAAEARITYLGVGGFLISTTDESALTAPSFTHPGLLAVITPFWPIRSDSVVVDRQLHRLLGPDLSPLARASAILVGHAHYDHLMDVPLVARRYAPRAVILGSITTKRTLMGDSSLRAQPWRIDSLAPADSVIATGAHVGRWIYSRSRRMRFMAVKSGHVANWWRFTIAPCHVGHDRRGLPRSGWTWCLGEPLSYVIDVLDTAGTPALRIFYQDAAAGPGDVALPPFGEGDRRPVDVLIVCAGNFAKAAGYPDFLVRALHPAHVIVSHWEDLFDAPNDAPTPIRRTDTRELAARLDRTAPQRWITLLPGGGVRVEY